MIAGPAPAPGCISVHVRHGDKGVEAQTFDDQVRSGRRTGTGQVVAVRRRVAAAAYPCACARRGAAPGQAWMGA